jgi:hypothetical protein
MGETCCSLCRIGPSQRPLVKVVETKLVIPTASKNENRLPEVITLGVLDHVTAPQMVSFLILFSNTRFLRSAGRLNRDLIKLFLDFSSMYTAN